MIEISDKSKCFGCGGCALICPSKCIEMSFDEEGFLYPVIKDKTRCINCGLCQKVCPAAKLKKGNNNRDTYWAKNVDDNIRMKSSSGGLFFVLAQYVLEKKGIVIGAAFSSDFYSAEHIVIDDINNLNKVLGSKYVQSSTRNTFSEVKKYLLKNSLVLFSGTPCQIAGLKSFLGKEYDNLLTVDVVCHGVPSPYVWKLYVQAMERKYGGRVKNISFRNKKTGWKKYSILMEFENNKLYQIQYTDDMFMRGFLANIFLRPSCYQCEFKEKNYWSDVTLGDFWGIQNVSAKIDDNKGVSVMLVNTKKGKEMLESIKEKISFGRVEYEYVINENKSIIEASIYPPERRNYFNRIKKRGLENTIDFYTSRSLIARISRKIRRILYSVSNK